MTDKELDQLIRTKLAGKSYPYNPANWKAMEAMLDQAQGSSTPVYWRQTAAIMLLALLLAIPLLWQNTGTKTFPANQQQQPVSTQNLETSQQKPVLENNSPETENTEPGAASLPGAIANGEAGNNAPVSESNTSSSSSASTTNTPVFASAESGSGNKASNSAIAEASVPARQQPIYLAVSDKNTENVMGHYNFNVKLMPLALENVTPAKPIIDPRALAKFDNRHEFSLQAGPSVNQAYNNQTGTGWQLGLHYRYRAFTNLAFTTSVNYVRTGDMGINTVADSVFFGFGRTEVHTEKNYRQISSIRLPLKAEYNLSPKHIISGGVFADMVTAVQMDMRKTTKPYKADPRVENHSSAKPRNEFSNVNYGATAGYFYRYDPRLSIGLNINYSLTDLTNDHYQKFEGDHRLLQSELVIRYRMF